MHLKAMLGVTSKSIMQLAERIQIGYECRSVLVDTLIRQQLLIVQDNCICTELLKVSGNLVTELKHQLFYFQKRSTDVLVLLSRFTAHYATCESCKQSLSALREQMDNPLRIDIVTSPQLDALKLIKIYTSAPVKHDVCSYSEIIQQMIGHHCHSKQIQQLGIADVNILVHMSVKGINRLEPIDELHNSIAIWLREVNLEAMSPQVVCKTAALLQLSDRHNDETKQVETVDRAVQKHSVNIHIELHVDLFRDLVEFLPGCSEQILYIADTLLCFMIETGMFGYVCILTRPTAYAWLPMKTHSNAFMFQKPLHLHSNDDEQVQLEIAILNASKCSFQRFRQYVHSQCVDAIEFFWITEDSSMTNKANRVIPRLHVYTPVDKLEQICLHYRHKNQQRQQLDTESVTALNSYETVFSVGSLPIETLLHERALRTSTRFSDCDLCLNEILLDSLYRLPTKKVSPQCHVSCVYSSCLRNKTPVSTLTDVQRSVKACYSDLTLVVKPMTIDFNRIDISLKRCDVRRNLHLSSWIFTNLDGTPMHSFISTDLDKQNCSSAHRLETNTENEETKQFPPSRTVCLNTQISFESPSNDRSNSRTVSGIILPSVGPETLNHTMVTLPENKNKNEHSSRATPPSLEGHSDTSNDHVTVIRDLTWLPPDQLPVPDIELTVANVFESMDEIFHMMANGDMPGPQVTMRYELLRLCTLRNYPRIEKPYIIRFAGAGFYYAACEDEVICFTCGLRKRNWKENDVPMEVHKRHSPNCRFLTHNADVNVPVPNVNVPEQRESRPERNTNTTLSDPDTTATNENAIMESQSWLSAEPIPTRMASTMIGHGDHTPISEHRDHACKFPQYLTRTLRLNTYDGWPDNNPHTPETLADAGFFYAGIGDCVRCFHCGIGLRNWTVEDDVNIEHARWSRNCWYLLQTKGDEFIQLVHLAMQLVQDEEEQPGASRAVAATDEEADQTMIYTPSGMPADKTAGNIPPSEEIERILRTDAAQSVLDMGYQPRIIKKAIERVLLHTGATGIKAEMLMEKVLEIEDEDEALTNSVSRLRINTSSVPESAGTDTESAQGDAESARGDAESARTHTESARTHTESARGETESGATGSISGSVHHASIPISNTFGKTSFKASHSGSHSGRCVCKKPVAAAQSCAVEALRYQVRGASTHEQVVQDSPFSLEETNGTDTVREPETEDNGERPHRETVELQLNGQPRAIGQTGRTAKSLGNPNKSREALVLKAENNRLKEQSVCRVCKDKHVCIVFLPCGHLVTCEDCAPAMRTCPTCKALVKGTVKTYAV